jgi:hypothetical protein
MALFQVNYRDLKGNKISKIEYRDTSQFNISQPHLLGTNIYVSLFKYKHKDKCFPPSILNMNGKKYLMPEWEEVHPKTQLSDIIWEKPQKKKTLIEKFEFKSSSSNKLYFTKKTTKPNGEVTFSCSCPGFFRAKDRNKGCTHIQKLK